MPDVKRTRADNEVSFLRLSAGRTTVRAISKPGRAGAGAGQGRSRKSPPGLVLMRSRITE